MIHAYFMFSLLLFTGLFVYICCMYVRMYVHFEVLFIAEFSFRVLATGGIHLASNIDI